MSASAELIERVRRAEAQFDITFTELMQVRMRGGVPRCGHRLVQVDMYGSILPCAAPDCRYGVKGTILVKHLIDPNEFSGERYIAFRMDDAPPPIARSVQQGLWQRLHFRYAVGIEADADLWIWLSINDIATHERAGELREERRMRGLDHARREKMRRLSEIVARNPLALPDSELVQFAKELIG